MFYPAGPPANYGPASAARMRRAASNRSTWAREREDAHRFYFRHGLRIAAFHFQREL